MHSHRSRYRSAKHHELAEVMRRRNCKCSPSSPAFLLGPPLTGSVQSGKGEAKTGPSAANGRKTDAGLRATKRSLAQKDFLLPLAAGEGLPAFCVGGRESP